MLCICLYDILLHNYIITQKIKYEVYIYSDIINISTCGISR